jgi:putative flippase GtrA
VFLRWLKFNTVGLVGIGVQLAALAIYSSLLRIHYLVATGMAVETAVLHNYVWHELWTWRDRRTPRAGWRVIAGRLLRFHLGNGLASLLSNLLLMKFFVGSLGMKVLPANLLSIAITAVVNFLIAEFFVFRRRGPSPPSGS